MLAVGQQPPAKRKGDTMERTEFREWCIVELMGHSQIAGLLSEQAIGGETFIRVDVPKTEKAPGFTKMYGKGAIYSITPTDEITAKMFVTSMYQPPVDPFTIRTMLGAHEDGGDDSVLIERVTQ